MKPATHVPAVNKPGLPATDARTGGDVPLVPASESTRVTGARHSGVVGVAVRDGGRGARLGVAAVCVAVLVPVALLGGGVSVELDVPLWVCDGVPGWLRVPGPAPEALAGGGEPACDAATVGDGRALRRLASGAPCSVMRATAASMSADDEPPAPPPVAASQLPMADSRTPDAMSELGMSCVTLAYR